MLMVVRALHRLFAVLVRERIEPNCLIFEPVVLKRFRSLPLVFDFCVGIDALVELKELEAIDSRLAWRDRFCAFCEGVD
jgi:hypothetical protein